MTFQKPEILLFDQRMWAMYTHPLAEFGPTTGVGRPDTVVPWGLLKREAGWIYLGDSALLRGYQGRWLIDQHHNLTLSQVEARITPIQPSSDLIGWAERQSPWNMGGFIVPEGAMPTAPLSELVGLIPQPVDPRRLTPRWAPRHTYLVNDGQILIASSPDAFASVVAGGTTQAVVSTGGKKTAAEFDPADASHIDPSEAVFTGDLCHTAIQIEAPGRWRKGRLERNDAPLNLDNVAVFVCQDDTPSERGSRPMTAFNTLSARWVEVDDLVFDGLPVVADWFSGDLRLSQDDPIRTSSSGDFELRTEVLLTIHEGKVSAT